MVVVELARVTPLLTVIVLAFDPVPAESIINVAGSLLLTLSKVIKPNVDVAALTVSGDGMLAATLTLLKSKLSPLLGFTSPTQLVAVFHAFDVPLVPPSHVRVV